MGRTIMDQVTQLSILKKFEIEQADIDRVRAVGPMLMLEINDHLGLFYDWMSNHDEYQIFFANNPERMNRVQTMQAAYWRTFFEANLTTTWFAERRHVGAVHAHIDLPNDIYFAGVAFSAKSLIGRLRKLGKSVKDMDATVDSITKLIFLDSFVVIDEITRINREKIAAGSRALLEMSTPVTPIWEGILLLPLLGIIDSERTRDIMTKTLTKIGETRAKVFVLDISGVSAMDTAVANQLIKITKATQFMGCETIISGVSPTIAQTLVELGVNIGDVRTTATLRDSFELALRAAGIGLQTIAS
jgi:rsbT co-antagonist protein RsbR